MIIKKNLILKASLIKEENKNNDKKVYYFNSDQNIINIKF